MGGFSHRARRNDRSSHSKAAGVAFTYIRETMGAVLGCCGWLREEPAPNLPIFYGEQNGRGESVGEGGGTEDTMDARTDR